MEKKRYVRVDPFTGFPEKDVKEDAPTTSTAGVAATGDDPTVVVRKKKKKLYDGRTSIAKKFVERILKQRESRKLNKEEVELDEVLKPKDKKVIDDFVQANKGTGAQNFTKRGNIVDYEGRSLEKSGMGAQQIASIESDPKDSHKIKVHAKMDSRSTQSIVNYLKKSAKKYNIKVEETVKEEPMINEKKLAGFIAFYGDSKATTKKVEIPLNKAPKGIYQAKQIAIKMMNVPKSKQGLLSIEPAYEHTVNEEPMINEKIEYVEYKFKNRSDAMKAQKHFMKQNQGPDYEFMDDDINNGTLGVDAGKDDMTKHHNEVMRKFKPKIVSKEGLEEDFKGYGKHFALTLMPTLRKKVMKLLDKEKIEYDKFSRKFLFIGKDGGKAPISMKDQKSILSKIEKEIGKDNFNYTFQKEDVEFDDIEEAVANLYVKGDNPNQMAMKIAKNAKGLGLKSAMMGNQVRVKGSQKQVNDFMRSVLGKSSMGSPTEKGASNPQIDKMLNKQLKEDVFRSNDFVGKIMEKVNDFGNEHELVETNLKVLQNIVKKKQNQKVKFKDKQATVDLFTASAIMKVYDAVKPDNKKKIEKLMNGTLVDFLKLQKFAMKQVKFA